MKINTKEKLEILLFGLNAGRALEITLESGTSRALHFGSLDGVGFTVNDSGEIDFEGCETAALYSILGCLTFSNKEAKQWFSHIAKKKELNQ